MIGESDLTPYIPNEHFGFYHSKGYKISSLEQIYESTSEYLDFYYMEFILYLEFIIFILRYSKKGFILSLFWIVFVFSLVYFFLLPI
ncbi:hypothetical protein LEP1GSC170_3035 [Leptospira interrogans serovar Bataviae str. HAI135]|nr:hypothetical protein LEP1GSC170_3035 [Leptospira interrogans serovar Bataviae str. HAI135]